MREIVTNVRPSHPRLDDDDRTPGGPRAPPNLSRFGQRRWADDSRPGCRSPWQRVRRIKCGRADGRTGGRPSGRTLINASETWFDREVGPPATHGAVVLTMTRSLTRQRWRRCYDHRSKCPPTNDSFTAILVNRARLTQSQQNTGNNANCKTVPLSNRPIVPLAAKQRFLRTCPVYDFPDWQCQFSRSIPDFIGSTNPFPRIIPSKHE